jgi:RNA polymerase sigma-70 factor, ECF subfamily
MSRRCTPEPDAPAGTLDWLHRTAEAAVCGTFTPLTTAAKPQSEELALIARVLAGDTEAFYDLVRPHERTLYLTAWGILRSEADAEDAAQDAVLKAFLNLKQFRRESSFKTWLVQIVINEALARRRRASRRGEESLDAPADEDPAADYIPRDAADWREIPSETLARRELREALQAALMRLDEKYRSVLILRDVEGFNIEETAAILGISQANVKVRLLRARLQMRDQLAPGFDGAWTSGEPYRKVRSW